MSFFKVVLSYFSKYIGGFISFILFMTSILFLLDYIVQKDFIYIFISIIISFLFFLNVFKPSVLSIFTEIISLLYISFFGVVYFGVGGEYFMDPSNKSSESMVISQGMLDNVVIPYLRMGWNEKIKLYFDTLYDNYINSLIVLFIIIIFYSIRIIFRHTIKRNK